MTEFRVHDMDSAPEASRPTLEAAEKAYGFVPNLMGVFAESPAALAAYAGIAQQFAACSLSAVEQQVVLLTVSRYHTCEYCMSAHSMLARQAGMGAAVLEALRNDQPIPDERLQALSAFTRELVETRGWATSERVVEFEAAGFTRAQVLEVIVGIAQKIISNYTNHLAHTPLDGVFVPSQWRLPLEV